LVCSRLCKLWRGRPTLHPGAGDLALHVRNLDVDWLTRTSVDQKSERVSMAPNDLSASADVAAVGHNDPMANLEVARMLKTHWAPPDGVCGAFDGFD
jgi:hypothetical protein